MWDIVAKTKTYNGKGYRRKVCFVEKLEIKKLKRLNTTKNLNRRKKLTVKLQEKKYMPIEIRCQKIYFYCIS